MRDKSRNVAFKPRHIEVTPITNGVVVRIPTDMGGSFEASRSVYRDITQQLCLASVQLGHRLALEGKELKDVVAISTHHPEDPGFVEFRVVADVKLKLKTPQPTRVRKPHPLEDLDAMTGAGDFYNS